MIRFRVVSVFLLLSAAGCAPVGMGDAPPPASRREVLPAASTASEGTKADGVEARVDDPIFAFTEPPGDVLGLPGEFEFADSMLVSWAALDDWEARLVAAAAPFIQVYVVAPSLNVERIKEWLVYQGTTEETLATIVFLTEEEIGSGSETLDTIWMRDFGPLVPRTALGGHRIVDFRYYDDRLLDDAFPSRLGAFWGLPVSRPRLYLEGGNIQSNGAGTCVVTARAIEQNADSLDVGEQYVKDQLRDFLGCYDTIVVPRLVGEGTGHVDMFVHITGFDASTSTTYALVGEYTTGQSEANKAITDEAAQILTNAGFSVTRIPMPDIQGRVYRSYTNALAINDAVMVPVYGSDTAGQEAAIAAFENAYPGRTILELDADTVIERGGAIHCTTMSIGALP